MSERLRGRMRAIARTMLPTTLVLAALAASRPAGAQTIDAYFPSGVPGYDKSLGVTVLSRLRPLYSSPGVQAGDFTIRPDLYESFGYNSNVQGFQGAQGSPVIRTSPSISLASNWDRDRLGLSASVDSYTYTNTPSQNQTNASVSIGGGYTIGRNDLDLAYSHLSQHQSALDLGAVATDVPVHYNVDDLRGDYTFDLGRLSFVPNVDVADYQFDNATVEGITTGQQYRDRVVGTGGVTTRYQLSDQHNLLLVLEGVDSHYTEPQPNQPSNNSTSVLVMGGIDYQADGVFRYRLLAGIEHRDFASSAFKARTAPVIQAGVIWTPTGLTTVTASVSRTIEDVAAEGTAGYIYTRANVVVDHEYLRNVLLQGRAGFQAAQFLTGGTQTNYSVGGGVTWLLNRYVRLSADYNFDYQTNSGGGATTIVTQPFGTGTAGSASGGFIENGVAAVGFNPNAATSSGYMQHVVLLTLHLAL